MENLETITVTHGDEEKKFTLDEAKDLILKALSNDEELTKLRADFENLSSREGLSVEELSKALSDGDFSKARFSRLLERYPELKSEELDSAFFESLNDGTTPIEAYQNKIIEDLNARLRTAENEKLTLGSAKSEIAEEVLDEFLQGFYGNKY